MNMRTRPSRTVLIGTAAATILTGAVLAASAQAQAEPTASAPAAPVSFEVGTRPESITKAWDGRFYVSIQGVPTLGVNDGEIRIFDPKTGAVTPFAQGFENPRGLAFTGRFLVVTDTTKVWIIERSGAARVLADSSAFPRPIAFLNDAAPEPGGRAVFVTEMGGRGFMRDPATGFLWPTDSPQALQIPATSRVYRIGLNGKVTDAVTPSRRLLVMNGVTQSNNDGHLICVDMFYGNVVDVDLRTNRKLVLGSGFRAADGVEQGRDGTIYVASFDNGRVWRMDRDGENPQVLLDLGDQGRSTTADLTLDEREKRLLVPDTTHNSVIIVPLG